MSIFKRWKEEWWAKRESNLAQEYAERERELKSELDSHIEKDRASFNKSKEKFDAEINQAITQLELRKLEVEEYLKRIEDRRVELAHKNEEYLTQLRLIEAKASPSQVWTEAFTLGFSKAWDMKLDVMRDGLDRSRQLIRDTAISETIARMNGNHKKDH